MATKPTPSPKPAQSSENDDLTRRIEASRAEQQALAEANVKYVWIPGPRKRKSARQRPGYSIEGEEQPTIAMGGQQKADDVKTWVYNPAMLPAIVAYMKARGIEVNTFEDVEKLWITAVERATNAYMGSGKRLERSPWDMLDLIAPAMGDDEADAWKGDSFNEVTRTTNVAEMGPETARQVLTTALTEALQRAPTQEEIEDFASRANAIVSANPQMTETTSTMEWDPNLNGPGEGGYKQVASTSKQVGRSGEEVQAMVQNEAIDRSRENPEYGEIQASTNLVNALFEAIASPVSG